MSEGKRKFADGTVSQLFSILYCVTFSPYSAALSGFPSRFAYKFVCKALAPGLSAGEFHIVPEIIGGSRGQVTRHDFNGTVP